MTKKYGGYTAAELREMLAGNGYGLDALTQDDGTCGAVISDLLDALATPQKVAESAQDVAVPLGWETLRDVVRCLREMSFYRDDEGEATNALEALLAAAPTQQAVRASEAGEAVVPIPRVHGVGRMADNPCAVLVMLKAKPSNDALRAIHDRLAAPAQQAVTLTGDARDAARYRWLSRQAVATHTYEDNTNNRWEVDYVLRGTSFGDAIDAALQSHSTGEAR